MNNTLNYVAAAKFSMANPNTYNANECFYYEKVKCNPKKCLILKKINL